MPFSCSLDSETRSLRIDGRGDISWADLEPHLQQILADKSVPVPYRHLFDLSLVDGFDFSPADLKSMVRLYAESPGTCGGRLAFVAVTPIVFGSCRMFEGLTQGIPDVYVTESIDVARRHLEFGA